jgi:hypothetical protein
LLPQTQTYGQRFGASDGIAQKFDVANSVCFWNVGLFSFVVENIINMCWHGGKSITVNYFLKRIPLQNGVFLIFPSDKKRCQSVNPNGERLSYSQLACGATAIRLKFQGCLASKSCNAIEPISPSPR